MCQNGTVSESVVSTHADLGRRIAAGREDAGLTQDELANRIRIVRTGLSKIETGQRKVTATELVAIAAALDRPIDWFVTESPPAVVSRRTSPGATATTRLDARVEFVARDVQYLLNAKIIPSRERLDSPVPRTVTDAEALAAEARQRMEITTGPLYDLQRAVERVGLLAFALDLGPNGGDAAYTEIDGWGVAVINSAVEAGRRRFNLAHELGHHLTGDAYTSETTIGNSHTEKMFNAFAIHLLLPRADVTELWSEFGKTRLAAVAIATRYRVSWTATCSHLRTLRLVSAKEREEFAEDPPRPGDIVEIGERWTAELDANEVPPGYGRRVVSAYRTGKLTSERTLELLHNSLSSADLPDVEGVPLEALRRDFEPMRQ